MQKALFLIGILTLAGCNKSITEPNDPNGNFSNTKKITTVQTFAVVSTNYGVAPALPESVKVTLADNTTENRKVQWYGKFDGTTPGIYLLEANLNPLGTTPYPNQPLAEITVQVKDVEGIAIPWTDSISGIGRGGPARPIFGLYQSCFDLTDEKVNVKKINMDENTYFIIGDQNDFKNAKIKFLSAVDSANNFWSFPPTANNIEIIIQYDKIIDTYSLIGKPKTFNEQGILDRSISDQPGYKSICGTHFVKQCTHGYRKLIRVGIEPVNSGDKYLLIQQLQNNFSHNAEAKPITVPYTTIHVGSLSSLNIMSPNDFVFNLDSPAKERATFDSLAALSNLNVMDFKFEPN